jgi:5'(3')-deoxyribonucleotidase
MIRLCLKRVKPFMIQSLQKHISMGLHTDEVFILGKKNAGFIKKLNIEKKLFGKLTVLEHPRFIQQYKFKERERYIDQFIVALTGEEDKSVMYSNYNFTSFHFPFFKIIKCGNRPLVFLQPEWQWPHHVHPFPSFRHR